MPTPYKVQCSKCGVRFEATPGELNSTCYLGKVSMLYGAGGYLPQCPHCENWRGNQFVGKDEVLSKPLTF